MSHHFKFWLTALLATIAITSVSLLYMNRASQLKNDTKLTIGQWESCLQSSTILTCDEDSSNDRGDCYNTANATVACNQESSINVSQECMHWWIYYETSKSTDFLPESFNECAQSCLDNALTNRFYFNNVFTPFWLNCALPYPIA